MSRVEIPLPLLFVWVALTLVLMVQGWRLSEQQQIRVEPARFLLLEPGDDPGPIPAETRLVYLGPAAERLALYQDLPERKLLRWLEDGEGSTRPLVIPLEGLGPGHYLVCSSPTGTEARGEEMDRPGETLQVRAGFTISTP